MNQNERCKVYPMTNKRTRPEIIIHERRMGNDQFLSDDKDSTF
jgi:hypothetical protein